MKETRIVNEDYLSGLVLLSQEQKDDDLVGHLFRNLQTEYSLFRKECEPYLTDPEKRVEFQHRIHKLKNNFFNLGCEEAGAVLEEMYQLLKSPSPDVELLHLKWTQFPQIAEQTFAFLNRTLYPS